MRARRVVAPAMVAALALGLTGCNGGPRPGTAATVGDDSISVAEVQELTSAFCEVVAVGVESGQAQPAPLAQQKQALLGVLIDVELDEQLAEARGVTPPPEVVSLLAANLRAGFGGGFEQLDDGDAEVLGGLVDRLAAARASLAAVAAEETGTDLTAENLDALQQQGLQLREDFVAGVDVETDPRYAPGPDGLPGGGDGSVSLAQSDVAQAAQAAADGSDPAYATGLPASQRCGG